MPAQAGRQRLPLSRRVRQSLLKKIHEAKQHHLQAAQTVRSPVKSKDYTRVTPRRQERKMRDTRPPSWRVSQGLFPSLPPPSPFLYSFSKEMLRGSLSGYLKTRLQPRGRPRSELVCALAPRPPLLYRPRTIRAGHLVTCTKVSEITFDRL